MAFQSNKKPLATTSGLPKSSGWEAEKQIMNNNDYTSQNATRQPTATTLRQMGDDHRLDVAQLLAEATILEGAPLDGPIDDMDIGGGMKPLDAQLDEWIDARKSQTTRENFEIPDANIEAWLLEIQSDFATIPLLTYQEKIDGKKQPSILDKFINDISASVGSVALSAWRRSVEQAHENHNLETESKLFGTLRMVRDDFGLDIRMNDLDNRAYVNGQPLEDAQESLILVQVQERWKGKKSPSFEVIRHALNAYAAARKFHPIREYLNGLQWDGRDRLTELAGYIQDTHTDFGNESVFHTAFRRWGVGAVAKILGGRDGIHAQNFVLVLAGKQGLGKSTFARWLTSGVGENEYFAEEPIDPANEQHQRLLTTKWIWESGEFGTVTRNKDREALKQFITKIESTFKVPYHRYPITKPVISSFIGTINNEDGFLNDPTGNRRFFPLELESIDHGYTSMDVSQLWAQLVAMYRNGESWRLVGAEIDLHEQQCALYKVRPAIDDYINSLFDLDPEERDWFTQTAVIRDAVANAGYNGQTSAMAREIASALALRGHEGTRRRMAGDKNIRGYVGVRATRIK